MMLAEVLVWSALAAQTAPQTRFALVMGNNTPDSKDVTALRYADDDALSTHALLTDAGVRSILLVHPDQDTLRQRPEAAQVQKPTVANLRAALKDLRAQMAEAARHGRVEFLFFYSGHGNVQNGEGYIVLEDGRFTRSDMLADVLVGSPAHANHVIVDACKSFFLIFDKGAGGFRKPAPRGFAQVGREVLERTGFVLSTSSDRDSHEWERFQGGVFSHELRSGLRGAADADADGRITYAELGAFLEAANRGIANARFRPDFLVRAPSRTGVVSKDLDQGILTWDSADTLLLDGGVPVHLYVEDGNGARLADVHAASGEPRVLHLPQRRPLFVRTADEATEYGVATHGPQALSALTATPGTYRSKGALNLAFAQLFGVPFAHAEVKTFRECQERLSHEAAVQQSRRDAILLTSRLAALAAAGAGLVALVPAAGLMAAAALVAAKDISGGWIPSDPSTHSITPREAAAGDAFAAASVVTLLLGAAIVGGAVLALAFTFLGP